MRIEEKTLYLSKSELACLATFASRDEARVNLTGILVAFDGRLFATDGHRLIAVSEARSPGFNADVPKAPKSRWIARPHALEIAKMAKPSDEIEIDCSSESCLIVTVRTPKTGSVQTRTIDTRPGQQAFPPYNQVLTGWDKAASGAPTQLNPAYMADLSKLKGIVTGVYVKSTGELEPYYCHGTAEGVHWLIVTMPMRGSGEDLPKGWAKPAPKAADPAPAGEPAPPAAKPARKPRRPSRRRRGPTTPAARPTSLGAKSRVFATDALRAAGLEIVVADHDVGTLAEIRASDAKKLVDGRPFLFVSGAHPNVNAALRAAAIAAGSVVLTAA